MAIDLIQRYVVHPAVTGGIGMFCAYPNDLDPDLCWGTDYRFFLFRLTSNHGQPTHPSLWICRWENRPVPSGVDPPPIFIADNSPGRCSTCFLPGSVTCYPMQAGTYQLKSNHIAGGNCTKPISGDAPIDFRINDPTLDAAVVIDRVTRAQCVNGITINNGSATITFNGGGSASPDNEMYIRIENQNFDVVYDPTGIYPPQQFQIFNLAPGNYPIVIYVKHTYGAPYLVDTNAQQCQMGYSLGELIIHAAPCTSCYVLTDCDGTYYNLENPVVTDLEESPPLAGNPENYLVNVFSGIVTFPSGLIIESCWTLNTANCDQEPIQVYTPGVTIDITHYSFTDCLTCEQTPASPPEPDSIWKLTRCDDEGVFFITNTNLSAISGKIINGLVIGGCPNTIPCAKPEQCWEVTSTTAIVSYVPVVTYNEVFPDCECCKTPC